ncbi:MAG: 50S ribosomal protein L29 [Candidatus Aenigmarchaeota archaeon]|nr:50S ribosomal protein L29 [Candidatus Aenigmarchaeota archaeon]
MVIIRKKEMAAMAPKDMPKKIEELRLEIAKEKAQISVGAAPKNTGKLREMKKTIARLLTEMKSRKI